MKITRKQLKALIKEELESPVRLRRQPVKTLSEAMMVSLKPITSHPDTGKASTMETRWAKLSGIPEEHINLSESIMDTTPLDDLIGTMAGEFTDRMRDMAGEIVDRFGNEMGRLWDEDPAMMREQGYTDKSQWISQVGSAEIALENELQKVMKSDDEQEDELYQAIKRAVEEVETRLHDGQFYDERDSRSSMGGRDSNNDGKLDPGELRDIADDLEGEEEYSNPLSDAQNEGTTLEQMPATWRQVLKTCLKD